MFGFFKKTVVLDVDPAFSAQKNADSIELVVDSGSQDVNRTQPKRITVKTLDGYHLEFIDFDVIYRRYDAIKKELIVLHGDGIRPFSDNVSEQLATALSTLKNNQAIVLGSVNLVNGNEIVRIANPVYIVNGTEKGGRVEFLDDKTIHDYVTSEWNDAFLVAKNNIQQSSNSVVLEKNTTPADLDGNATSVAQPMVDPPIVSASTTSKDDKKNNFIPLIAASVLGVGIAFSAFAYTQTHQNNTVASDTTEQSQSDDSVPSIFGGKNKAQTEKTTDDDSTIREMVQAASGKKSLGLTDVNGKTSNTQNMSVEDLATAQVKATEVMLKKMNIEVGANEDLGCLTQ